MKKLVSVVLAGIMVLLVGCKMELPKIEIVHSDEYTNEDVMKDGRFFLSDFYQSDVKNFLEYAMGKDTVHIVIQSSGGNALNCMAFINAIQDLQSQGVHIVTESYGAALSAGFLTFLAGDTRIAHTGTIFMSHGAGFVYYGDRVSHNKIFEKDNIPHDAWHFLELLDSEMRNLLEDKTSLTDKQIEGLLYHEDNNFLSAEEAYEVGIANELL